MSIESNELRIAQEAKAKLATLGHLDDDFKNYLKGLPSNIVPKKEGDFLVLDYSGLKLKILYARTNKKLKIGGISMRQLKCNDKKKRGIGLKPIMNAVPAGAVYYFEIMNADKKTASILKSLDGSKIEHLHYSKMGFNQVTIAKITN